VSAPPAPGPRVGEPLATRATPMGAALREGVLARPQGRLRFLTGGRGPALLLCHGFLGSAENFEGWLPALLPRRTVVIPDLPGFGVSAPLPGLHTAAALADEMVALAGSLGHDRYDLAGLCLGASVALAVAEARPAAASSLILHTPLLDPTVVRRRFRRQVRTFTAPGVFSTITWLARRRRVSDWYKRHVTEGVEVDPGPAQVNFDNQLRASPRAARAWLRDGLARDFRARVAGWDRPVLLMVAADDRIVDVPRLVELVAPHTQIELEVVSAAGHGWTAEFVARQQALLASFLDRVDGGDPAAPPVPGSRGGS